MWNFKKLRDIDVIAIIKTNKIFIVITLLVVIILFLVIYYNNVFRSFQRVTTMDGQIVAVGQCAACHVNVTPAIVKQWGESKMSKAGVTCIDCHTADRVKMYGTEKDKKEHVLMHNGYEIVNRPSSGNCSKCHPTQFNEFTASGHAAKSWVSVKGSEPFTEEQLKILAEYHPQKLKGGKANPNKLGELESAHLLGDHAIRLGCMKCHGIGEPNPDTSVGRCSSCHMRHSFSIGQARESHTCGQCHVGPDHPQIEIWEESAHGVLFGARKEKYHMENSNENHKISDQDAPTCSTCHMAGFSGQGMTHNVNERLSWHAYAPITKPRKNWRARRNSMQKVCSSCHSRDFIATHFFHSDKVVEDVNVKVSKSLFWMNVLLDTGHRTKAKFDEEVEFIAFNLWHHWGRTAKFGAFMSGPDFVQWHGMYPLFYDFVKIETIVKKSIGIPKFNALKAILENNRPNEIANYFPGARSKKYKVLLKQIYDKSFYKDSPLSEEYINNNVPEKVVTESIRAAKKR